MIEILPEFGVEIPPRETYMELQERAHTACNTIALLSEHGLDIEPCSEDDYIAEQIAMAYATDTEATSKTLTHKNFSDLTPAAVLKVTGILDEYGHNVARKASAVRNMVYNKLILESENADARIRMKALELLGKTVDVGLFVEKKEVTHVHQSPEAIREELREKLLQLKKNEEGVYEVEPAPREGEDAPREGEDAPREGEETGVTSE